MGLGRYQPRSILCKKCCAEIAAVMNRRQNEMGNDQRKLHGGAKAASARTGEHIQDAEYTEVDETGDTPLINQSPEILHRRKPRSSDRRTPRKIWLVLPIFLLLVVCIGFVIAPPPADDMGNPDSNTTNEQVSSPTVTAASEPRTAIGDVRSASEVNEGSCGADE